MRCNEAARWLLGSCRFRCPPPLAGLPSRPVAASPAEVFVLADQLLVELSGEQGGLSYTEVMAEGAAGEADLLAAAGDQ